MAKKFAERRWKEYLFDMLQNCRKLNSVGRAARNARSMKPRKYSQTILII